MLIEKKLKDFILKNYSNVKHFTLYAKLPYTTVDSLLKNYIEKANIATILKICNTFNSTLWLLCLAKSRNASKVLQT